MAGLLSVKYCCLMVLCVQLNFECTKRTAIHIPLLLLLLYITLLFWPFALSLNSRLLHTHTGTHTHIVHWNDCSTTVRLLLAVASFRKIICIIIGFCWNQRKKRKRFFVFALSCLRQLLFWPCTVCIPSYSSFYLRFSSSFTSFYSSSFIFGRCLHVLSHTTVHMVWVCFIFILHFKNIVKLLLSLIFCCHAVVSCLLLLHAVARLLFVPLRIVAHRVCVKTGYLHV